MFSDHSFSAWFLICKLFWWLGQCVTVITPTWWNVFQQSWKSHQISVLNSRTSNSLCAVDSFYNPAILLSQFKWCFKTRVSEYVHKLFQKWFEDLSKWSTQILINALCEGALASHGKGSFSIGLSFAVSVSSWTVQFWYWSFSSHTWCSPWIRASK